MYACENSNAPKSCCLIMSARMTFMPVNIQQRPERFWSVMPLLVTRLEKCVSMFAKLSWLSANLLMGLLHNGLKL